MKTTPERPAQAVNSPALVSSDRSHALSVPPALAALALISLGLTLTVGSALLFFPEAVQDRWVWPLKPYNTRFLGAFYLTASVGFISLLSGRRSALARLIVPMFLVFTANALMVCCLQLQQFNPGRRATDIWFWLYLADCIGSAYYFAYYKQHPFLGLRRLPSFWPFVLGVQAGLIGVYGLSLLFFPVATGSNWLWPLDVFHSQLYSSIFLAGAVGAAILSRRAAASELRALGSIQVVFSVLVALGVWLVDKDVRGIDWSLGVSWVWVGAIALLGIIGMGLIQQSRQMQRSSQQ